MAVQSLGRRSTQLLPRRLPYKALDGRLQMARAPRPGAGSGLGQVRAWGGGGGACSAAGPRRSWGHSVAGGVGPGPAVGIRTGAPAARRPGWGLGEPRASRRPPAGGAVLRDPGPAGETHLYRAPGSEVTGDRPSRSRPSQGLQGAPHCGRRLPRVKSQFAQATAGDPLPLLA